MAKSACKNPQACACHDCKLQTGRLHHTGAHRKHRHHKRRKSTNRIRGDNPQDRHLIRTAKRRGIRYYRVRLPCRSKTGRFKKACSRRQKHRSTIVCRKKGKKGSVPCPGVREYTRHLKRTGKWKSRGLGKKKGTSALGWAGLMAAAALALL